MVAATNSVRLTLDESDTLTPGFLSPTKTSHVAYQVQLELGVRTLSETADFEAHAYYLRWYVKMTEDTLGRQDKASYQSIIQEYIKDGSSIPIADGMAFPVTINASNDLVSGYLDLKERISSSHFNCLLYCDRDLRQLKPPIDLIRKVAWTADRSVKAVQRAVGVIRSLSEL